ncbi:lipopolysaccharide biosynthesis protein [Streptomyces tsukubensis]|uniref:Lipopolysaccharide biosynthesis protein n=1 Tax=Streptomyces tsukubensis TaxID=83656 RepID=A0A1V4A4J2_9ACTN|nr:lipopolysaccharide biosynthesis protein [Streptomyces tsukubensis]OON75370.1 lipopolysaccharide biosynthesis protein [Streptomyces tsukubensis]QFR95001.1 lipopolysaccharide biosynthesis protein [Streptomyces tsukubensis]
MTETTDTTGRPTTHDDTLAGRARSRLVRLSAGALLAGGVLAGAGAGALYGLLAPAEYAATSYVLASPTGKSDPATALGFAQAYGRVATQVAVLGDAQVGAGVPVSTLRDSVTAQTSPDAPMIAITATAEEAERAAEISNAVARSLTVNAGHSEDNTHVKLLALSRAVPPAEPTSATAPLTALVGGCAGGLLGGLALLVRPRTAAGVPARAAETAAVPGPSHAAESRKKAAR